jgi:tRNA(Met) cytidine acetyltransferase
LPSFIRKIHFVFHLNEIVFSPSIRHFKKSAFFSDQKIDRNENEMLPIHKAKAYLGEELHFLYFDASLLFDVNAFLSVLGCLMGGGLLVLCLPEVYKKSLNQKNKASIHHQLNTLLSDHFPAQSSHLLFRFVQHCYKHPQIDSFYIPLEISLKKLEFFIDNNRTNTIKNTLPQSSLFFEQQKEVLEKIKRCSLGHAKRPLMIIGDRGRGKSTVLAFACASLLYFQKKRIFISAPKKSTLSVFYRHLENELKKLMLDERPLSNTSHHHCLESIQSNIQFKAIDDLLSHPERCDLLIIDEAASVPIHVLKPIIQFYHRFVLSSTVTGYEGNGRGLEIKLFPILSQCYPQWRLLHLSLPYRWELNDPLEMISNQAFLLEGSQKKQKEKFAIKKIEKVIFRCISQTELIQDNDILSAIFALLTEAHYQTKPSDLERILSDPHLMVFVAIHSSFNSDEKNKKLFKDSLLGAALVVNEGQLLQKQCKQIEQGHLRLKGHLLPHSLMAYLGIEQAGLYHYWRVMRIAVTPNVQHQGVGQHFIQWLIEQAKKENVDMIGSSFALTPLLLRFWNQLNFLCFRLAKKHDSSTGLIPADFLHVLSQRSKPIYDQAIQRFQSSFVYLAGSAYKKVDISLLLDLMRVQILPFSSLASLSAPSTFILNFSPMKNNIAFSYVLNEVKSYLKQARSFEMVEWILFQWVHSLAHYWLYHPCEITKKLLFSVFYQKKGWNTICKIFPFKGKKAAQQALRLSIEWMTVQYESTEPRDFLSKQKTPSPPR